jgi:hypothetical protein
MKCPHCHKEIETCQITADNGGDCHNDVYATVKFHTDTLPLPICQQHFDFLFRLDIQRNFGWIFHINAS